MRIALLAAAKPSWAKREPAVLKGTQQSSRKIAVTGRETPQCEGMLQVAALSSAQN